MELGQTTSLPTVCAAPVPRALSQLLTIVPHATPLYGWPSLTLIYGWRWSPDAADDPCRTLLMAQVVLRLVSPGPHGKRTPHVRHSGPISRGGARLDSGVTWLTRLLAAARSLVNSTAEESRT